MADLHLQGWDAGQGEIISKDFDGPIPFITFDESSLIRRSRLMQISVTMEVGGIIEKIQYSYYGDFNFSSEDAYFDSDLSDMILTTPSYGSIKLLNLDIEIEDILVSPEDLFELLLDKDNEIIAGKHNDSISSYKGDDTIQGGLGDDQINPGTGSNSVDGGKGYDTIILKGRQEDYIINPNKDNSISFESVIDEIIVRLENIEEIKFTKNSEAITIQTLVESLHDVYPGEEESILDFYTQATYTFFGDDDDEKIRASANNTPTAMYGLSGNDTLIGNKGNDLLDGGDGDDLLKGKKGADLYVLSPGLDTFKGLKPKQGDAIAISSNYNYSLIASRNDTIIDHEEGSTRVKKISPSDLESLIEIV